jgi:hypothetical protein
MNGIMIDLDSYTLVAILTFILAWRIVGRVAGSVRS